jgi:PAS domain-containing protein
MNAKSKAIRAGVLAAPSKLSEEVYLLDRDHPAAIEAQCTACEITQRYRSLIEAGPSIIVCLSPDHRILEFNRAAERLYRLQRAPVWLWWVVILPSANVQIRL